MAKGAYDQEHAHGVAAPTAPAQHPNKPQLPTGRRRAGSGLTCRARRPTQQRQEIQICGTSPAVPNRPNVEAKSAPATAQPSAPQSPGGHGSPSPQAVKTLWGPPPPELNAHRHSARRAPSASRSDSRSLRHAPATAANRPEPRTTRPLDFPPATPPEYHSWPACTPHRGLPPCTPASSTTLTPSSPLRSGEEPH